MISELNNICMAACGISHFLALTKYGKVYGFGDNSCGQLGKLQEISYFLV